MHGTFCRHRRRRTVVKFPVPPTRALTYWQQGFFSRRHLSVVSAWLLQSDSNGAPISLLIGRFRSKRVTLTLFFLEVRPGWIRWTRFSGWKSSSFLKKIVPISICLKFFYRQRIGCSKKHIQHGCIQIRYAPRHAVWRKWLHATGHSHPVILA